MKKMFSTADNMKRSEAALKASNAARRLGNALRDDATDDVSATYVAELRASLKEYDEATRTGFQGDVKSECQCAICQMDRLLKIVGGQFVKEGGI